MSATNRSPQKNHYEMSVLRRDVITSPPKACLTHDVKISESDKRSSSSVTPHDSQHDGITDQAEDPGAWIRKRRAELRLRPTDVEHITRNVAKALNAQDYRLSHGSLWYIEKGRLPNVRKLFSLAVALQMDYEALLRKYGVNPNDVERFVATPLLGANGNSVISLQNIRHQAAELHLSFKTRVKAKETTLISQRIEQTELLPSAVLREIDQTRYAYAVIGTEDYMMVPLILPESVVEVDKTQNQVRSGGWRSLLERPIYLVWHERGHTCCWLQLDGNELTMLPHPASPCSVKRVKIPRDATVIGSVVHVWSALYWSGGTRV